MKTYAKIEYVKHQAYILPEVSTKKNIKSFIILNLQLKDSSLMRIRERLDLFECP